LYIARSTGDAGDLTLRVTRLVVVDVAVDVVVDVVVASRGLDVISVFVSTTVMADV
jgi:hypothetical protein